MADWQIRCCTCGRFLNPQTPGVSWVFVPSSDAPSYEEDRHRCVACTKELGPVLPNQRVRLDLCSGVIPSPLTQPEEPT